MTTSLDDDLRAMYAARSAHLPDLGPGLDHVRVVRVDAPTGPRGPRWMVGVAAAALVAVGVGGVLMLQRPRELRVSTSTVAPPAPLAGPGRLTVDKVPDGLALFDASEGIVADGGSQPITRIYATEGNAPEEGPYVRVDGMNAAVVTPGIADGAESVDVGGVSGHRWEADGVVHVVFQRGSDAFAVVTHDIDAPVAVAASARMAADGSGPVIDATLLPAGVSATSAGVMDEIRFIATDLTREPITSVHWMRSVSGDRGVFLRSWAEQPDQFLLHRVEAAYHSYATVDVGRWQAVQVSLTDPNPLTTVMWNDGTRTYVVSGWATVHADPVPADEVLAVARALRPATEQEWREMKVTATRNQREMQEQVATTTTTVVSAERPSSTSGG